MANTIPWTRTIVLLSLFLLQFLCVDGYFIDKECKPLANKLKLSMRKSMEMAETALKELDKEDNPHIKELREWFFRDQDLPMVKNVYSSMQKYKGFNKANTDNLIQPTIYCNLTHLEEKEEDLEIGGKMRYLINNAEKIKMDWDEGYEGCKNGDTIAYTSTIYKDAKKHLTIQLCPWYLNEVAGSTKFTNADGTLPDVSGKKKSYNPQRDPSAGDPRADIWASRLDFTLLHELVHALPDGHAIQGDPAYDWNPCIALGQNGGCLNAESYAFFALGVRKIKDEGLKFTKDGMTVSIEDANEKRSEQAVMKLWNA